MSCYILISLFFTPSRYCPAGNYLYTLTVSKYGNDFLFQAVLVVNASAFFLASVLDSPQMVFLAALVIQTCSGGYWPSIGWLRGRYFLPEVRSVTITLTRVLTLFIVAPLLWALHESPTLTMLACSGLNAVAVFLQFKITEVSAYGCFVRVKCAYMYVLHCLQAELKLQGETDEYECSDDEEN